MPKTNPQTNGQDNSEIFKGRTMPVGVGLQSGEVDYLDKIADEKGIARNALLHYAVRLFIIGYQAGKIDLTPMIETPPIPKKKLRLPE